MTTRTQLLNQLLPALRAGIRATRLRAVHADDALQQSLVALIPHLERLSTMPQRESAAYAYVVAARAAMALRKRVGIEEARGSDEAVDAWDREVARRTVTPEQIMLASQGAAQAKRVFEQFATGDRRIMAAVIDDGLSERDAARELGMSRGNLSYRLRRARDALARAWLGTTSWHRRPR